MVGFPDVRWGSERSRLRKPLTAIASTKPGSWFIRTMTPLDRAVLTRSNGRFTVLGPIGAPTLLLVTTGAKSGQERTSPLLYGRDGDQLIVVGSNWGQPHHPAWTGNLIKQPEAEVIMGGRRIAVHARLLAGDEAEAAYRKMIAVNSVYAAYRGRTDRAIRVFTLAAISPLP